MTPQMQTIFDDKTGDCLRTCVASILDVPAAELPNFVDQEDWIDAVNTWLRPRGLFMVVTLPPQAPMGWSVASVPSRYGRWQHAVVASDGLVVHDPDPSRPRTNRNRHRYAEAFFSFIPIGGPDPERVPLLLKDRYYAYATRSMYVIARIYDVGRQFLASVKAQA